MSEDKKPRNNASNTDERSISDYLQSPRRKRRTYIFVALEPGFDKDLASSIFAFLKRFYPQFAISQPRSPAEFARQFGRVISLVIISDEFDPEGGAVELIRKLKEVRHQDTIPVVFLTRNAENLVEQYHKYLLPYHESDEYIQYPGINAQKILARIKVGLESRNQRRSRRYKIGLPVSIFHLTKDQTISGEILDLSIHGALIKAHENMLFKESEQLRLSIPTQGILPPKEGEFLKLSAKVRRVYISGDIAGISFEYISERQLADLTKFLSIIVNREMQRKSAKLRATFAATAKGDQP